MPNLILSRRAGQTIVLNENITITFIEFEGQSQIRIGIEAPSNVTIRRGELERKSSTRASDSDCGKRSPRSTATRR